MDSRIESKRRDIISLVVDNNLCMGCGTCVGLCPNGALEMKINSKSGYYVPLLRGVCNECGLCFRVCPGHGVDFKALNNKIFNNNYRDIILRCHINHYLGYATDSNIRNDSSSGGLITSILIFALEKEIITGVITTKMKDDKPLEPEVFIAKTKEEIIKASKSKYCPVPVNEILRNVLNSEDNERFAFVGLPCHIQGVRKAEQENKDLEKKIVLHLGIMCSHTDSFFATEFVLNCYDIKCEDVKKLEYRGRGWPGSMLVETKDDRYNIIEFKNYILAHELWVFSPRYCSMCCDNLAEMADISFGDAWYIETKDKEGTSIIISRTNLGEDVITKATSENILKLKEISRSEIIGSQGILSNSRIKYGIIALSLAKIIGRSYATHNADYLGDPSLRPNIIDYAKFTLYSANGLLLSKRVLWKASKLILPIERRIIKIVASK